MGSPERYLVNIGFALAWAGLMIACIISEQWLLVVLDFLVVVFYTVLAFESKRRKKSTENSINYGDIS